MNARAALGERRPVLDGSRQIARCIRQRRHPPGPDVGQNRVDPCLCIKLLNVSRAFDEALDFSFGLLRISHDAE